MSKIVLFLACAATVACAVANDQTFSGRNNNDSEDLTKSSADEDACEPLDTRVCVCEDRSYSVQECIETDIWTECDCPPREEYDGPKDTDDDDTENGNSQGALSSVVYANTETSLYYVDPLQSNAIQWIGDFKGPCTQGSGLYDIAVDQDENIVGIAAEALYTVDPETAACELLVTFPELSPHFFSLSYVKGVDPNDPDRDVLMAASVEDGQWVQINPDGVTKDELFVSHGYHDPGARAIVSSGDIVSLKSKDGTKKTYATLKCSSGYQEDECESDWLAEIDPVTGEAKLIGITGYQKIFGLGFWGDKVYGFTLNNECILIDIDTGKGELVSQYDTIQFWGAGSVTIPYVVVI